MKTVKYIKPIRSKTPMKNKLSLLIAKTCSAFKAIDWSRLFSSRLLNKNFNKKSNKKLRIAGAAGAVMLLICLGIGCSHYIKEHCPVILVADGQEIGLITGRYQVDNALATAQEELAGELGITVTGTSSELSYAKKSGSKEKPLEEGELVAVLKEKLNWQTNNWSIKINGKPVLSVASREEAVQALEKVKAYYIPQNIPQMKVEKSEFAEKVDIVAVQGFSRQLKTKDEVVETMIKGTDKIVQHTVQKGESLWTIARDNDLTVAALKEMNPGLKGELLQLDQILNLKKAQPLVTVVSTLTMTNEEKIPYDIVYESDNTLWKGQQKVKKAGKNGARMVTYQITRLNNLETDKKTIAEKIQSEPESRIVRKGTKIMVASRGDGGSGSLGWPIRGKINSPYGKKRGKSIHTGLDINGNTGDPVYSAGDGTVISARWNGNYGNCIDIDHGKGLVTRYAHLSAINVSVGQKVSRGGLIGKVGSTGRSTGSHLHFEVRVNGCHTSPLRYLN